MLEVVCSGVGNSFKLINAYTCRVLATVWGTDYAMLFGFTRGHLDLGAVRVGVHGLLCIRL